MVKERIRNIRVHLCCAKGEMRRVSDTDYSRRMWRQVQARDYRGGHMREGSRASRCTVIPYGVSFYRHDVI